MKNRIEAENARVYAVSETLMYIEVVIRCSCWRLGDIHTQLATHFPRRPIGERTSIPSLHAFLHKSTR